MIRKKDIPDWPGYRCTSDGKVWTCWTRKGAGCGRPAVMGTVWRELKGGKDKDGYVKLILCLGKKRRYVRRAKLIYETFVGVVPNGKIVRHGSSLRDDDRLCNLSVGTQKNRTARIKREMEPNKLESETAHRSYQQRRF